MNNAGTSPGTLPTESLEQGRAAFRNQQWGAAFTQLSAADATATLPAEDLAMLAQSALLTGRDVEGADLLARAHAAFAEKGEAKQAARCAFWLGFTSMLNGEVAKAGGWLARAARFLEDHPDCVEQGYLLLPAGYRAFQSGELTEAQANFLRAATVGKQYGENDLITLGLQGQGRALIRQGEIAQGLALLDEAMIAVTSGEVSPLNAGGVYCSVLDACGEIYDLQRAHEWTSALERWCESQPDLVPFRSHCQVRRAELLQLHGQWNEALAEAEQARVSLSRPVRKPALGAAMYRVAEVHRLRGEFAEAEKAYLEASDWQSTPGPGLALLRLAQGQVESASAAIRRQAEEVREPGRRALILDAYAEIAFTEGDIEATRSASDELKAIAEARKLPFLLALADRAAGAASLAEGDAQGALAELRRAWNLWCELQAPYEATRTRVLMGLAYRALDDEETARLEWSAAQRSFEELGARVELAKVQSLMNGQPEPAGVLTNRELEVLRLVARGMTNHKIGLQLHISNKTVARHVSNIFLKLDLRSRTAAAAYAYDHGLV
jgi:DNA-binding NarL/FixJ family response regulator